MEKIFLVYGYHKEEEFAKDVGMQLKTENLENLSVKEYDGQTPKTRRDKMRDLSLRKYLRVNLPFSYAIILHDAGPITEEIRDEKDYPSIFSIYFSKGEISREFRTKIEEQNQKMQKGRKAISFFSPNFRDMSKIYDRIDVEFYPHLVSKKEALEYTKGLIKTLSCH